MQNNIPKEREKYLKKLKKNKIIVKTGQIAIFTFVLLLWQLAANLEWIDTFILSSPAKIISSIDQLLISGQLWENIYVTLFETLTGFLLGLLIGVTTAVVLWWFPTVNKILEPYLIVLNAMPKIALGPVIIIWAGAGTNSIIIMTLLISTISTIIGMHGGFNSVDEEKITLIKTFGARKIQILTKVILPASYDNFISVLKINIGLSWVGVIMGEFLVSKAGLGYLIMYGSQVFNLTLVMAGILLVSICAALMYFAVFLIEKIIKKKFEYN